MKKNSLISRLGILATSAGLFLGCYYGVPEKPLTEERLEQKAEELDTKNKKNKEDSGEVILEFLCFKNYISENERENYKDKLDTLTEEQKKLVLRVYLSPREFYRNLDKKEKERFEGFRVRKLGSKRAVEVMKRFPWIGRNFEDLDYLMYTPVPGEEAKNERLSDYALGNKLILFYFGKEKN